MTERVTSCWGRMKAHIVVNSWDPVHKNGLLLELAAQELCSPYALHQKGHVTFTKNMALGRHDHRVGEVLHVPTHISRSN